MTPICAALQQRQKRMDVPARPCDGDGSEPNSKVCNIAQTGWGWLGQNRAMALISFYHHKAEREPVPVARDAELYCGPVLRHPPELMLPAVDLGGRVWLGSKPCKGGPAAPAVNPGWFEQNHLPRPENAAPAAALMLAPRERKCRNRKRGRFLWRMMIALRRRRMWASIARSPLAASAVHSRKCATHPFRYRLSSFMQAASERPQLGGVISRTVFLSRRSDFADRRTAVSQPSAVCRH
jgi:hypothetical protein